MNSSALRKPLTPGKQRPDHLAIVEPIQLKALYRDTPQMEVVLGDKHSRRSAKLDHGAPEKIELATNRTDITTERQDSLTASKHTVVSTVNLTSDGITDKLEVGTNMNLANEPDHEASRVESARETRPTIGDLEEPDEDLALHNHPDANLLAVPGQKARSEPHNLRPRRTRTTKAKFKTGCSNCR